MNETRIEKLAFGFTAICSLPFSGAAIATLVRLSIALAQMVMVQPAFPQSTTAGMRPRDVRSQALLR